MNTRPSDLIAIANSDLAQRLEQESAKKSPQVDDLASNDVEEIIKRDFDDDVFQAVYALNILRYILGLALAGLVTSLSLWPAANLLSPPLYPTVFLGCALALICSAILFSYLSKNRSLGLIQLASVQFSLDLLLAALLTYSMGGANIVFILLYFVVVSTGSIVLPRIYALALAVGATILLFGEHFLSVWMGHIADGPNYEYIAASGFLLLGLSALINHLASRIRAAEHQNFDPRKESIDEYLAREEATALLAALKSTEGNKTEAAKLLGMSFRSFRYKLGKYELN